jgi:cytoskeletal protein RodZ
MAAGQSLEEMARATRITTDQLRALEAGNLAELPAPVFVKGFIRAYCGFLGAPADEPLALYRRALGPEAAPPSAPARSRRATWVGHPLVVSGALVALFGAALLALALTADRAPAPSTGVDGPLAAPAPAPSASGLVGPVREAEAAVPHRLVVTAVQPTWIRVQTGDGRVAEALLAPGDTREWTSQTRFLLTVGNAGGVHVELNGRPLPSLGAPGTVIHRLALPAPPAGS